jgi:hypothetical protein
LIESIDFVMSLDFVPNEEETDGGRVILKGTLCKISD